MHRVIALRFLPCIILIMGHVGILCFEIAINKLETFVAHATILKRHNFSKFVSHKCL